MAIYPITGSARLADTEAECAAQNPLLGMGEILVARDTGVSKIGPGHWNSLTADSITVVDDDTMTNVSPSTVPSSESTRAYVDNEIAGLAEPGTGFDTSVPGFFSVKAIDLQEFTSSGTWTKPAGARLVQVTLIGGGGGGASGYRDAEGALRVGGGGGAPGGRKVVWLLASELDATEAVTIGAAGTGGAAKTANGVGNDGTAGGDTILDTIAGDVRAVGGQQGQHAGGFAAGNAGVGATGRGGYGYQTVMAAHHERYMAAGEAGGGGSGTGRTAANANTGGGNGGGTEAGLGGATGGPGANGAAGVGGLPGSGGGGGVLVGADGGWAGGNGGYPGGGGGGGSYGNAGIPTNSGAGGDGAAGYVLVLSFQ